MSQDFLDKNQRCTRVKLNKSFPISFQAGFFLELNKCLKDIKLSGIKRAKVMRNHPIGEPGRKIESKMDLKIKPKK